MKKRSGIMLVNPNEMRDNYPFPTRVPHHKEIHDLCDEIDKLREERDIAVARAKELEGTAAVDERVRDLEKEHYWHLHKQMIDAWGSFGTIGLSEVYAFIGSRHTHRPYKRQLVSQIETNLKNITAERDALLGAILRAKKEVESGSEHNAWVFLNIATAAVVKKEHPDREFVIAGLKDEAKSYTLGQALDHKEAFEAVKAGYVIWDCPNPRPYCLVWKDDKFMVFERGEYENTILDLNVEGTWYITRLPEEIK